MTDMVELQIAAAYLRGKFPNDGPLPERIKAAMTAVRKAPEVDVYWMSSRAPNDDLKFRTALAAVMLQGSDEDRAMIERSMRPLKALSALLSGVPIDAEAVLAMSEDTIPLMKLWHETKE